LHNVVKHSGATEVSVFLTTDAAGFTLIVRDNGKGFDPASVPPRPGRGNGLKNMTQRLEKIGGRCDIQSKPGAGTEVKFPVAIPTAKAGNAELKHVIN
jgi:signal transduction histidine kinase